MTAVPITLESRPDGVPAGSAAEELLDTDLGSLRQIARDATATDVERSLARDRRQLSDLAVLLSPAASDHLEAMAAAAHRVTLHRFGRTIHLFAPLYLSNECVSTCTYCGFSGGNEIARRTLSLDEIRREGEALAATGMRHVLLVAGEHARIVSKDYLVEAAAVLQPLFPSIAVEVQVWDTDTYRRLAASGVDGVVVYQETYDRSTYAAVHLKGKKRNYDWRLAAPDRAAEAGIRRLGVGALLGLHDDWRTEALALGAHASALMKRWWRCEVAVSLPRLRPAAGGYEPADPVGDREFVQLVCALRLVLPDVGITLSTREAPAFRDALVRLGVTHMSAGSHTEPGGYAEATEAEPQFEISDERSPAEVAEILRAAGYDPVWKDWQRT